MSERAVVLLTGTELAEALGLPIGHCVRGIEPGLLNNIPSTDDRWRIYLEGPLCPPALDGGEGKGLCPPALVTLADLKAGKHSRLYRLAQALAGAVGSLNPRRDAEFVEAFYRILQRELGDGS